jgi:hypothetical protein
MLIHEIAGTDPTAPLDTHSTHHQNPNTSPDNVTSGSAMTTVDGDYIFAATSDAANASGQTISAGTDETAREMPAIPGGNPMVSEDEIQMTAGTITSTFTFSANGGASLTAQIAFKP